MYTFFINKKNTSGCCDLAGFNHLSDYTILHFTCQKLTADMKRFIVISFLLLLFYPLGLSAQKENGDFFGNIANIQAQRLKLLEEKKPPLLPELMTFPFSSN